MTTHVVDRRGRAAQVISMLATPPWKDEAVLLRDDLGKERKIIAEGTLRRIVEQIAQFPASTWERYHISLPDRGAAPFAYKPSDFANLVMKVRQAG